MQRRISRVVLPSAVRRGGEGVGGAGERGRRVAVVWRARVGGRGPAGVGGGRVADGLAGGGVQGQGRAGLGGGAVAAELGSQVLGRGEDEGLEGVHSGGTGLGGVLAGGEQDPQGFAGVTGARLRGIGGGQ